VNVSTRYGVYDGSPTRTWSCAVPENDRIPTAAVASWLAKDWGLPGLTVVPHAGGMNSQTWLVTDGAVRWVAKAVPSTAGRQLAGGLSVAARVQAAGIPAGAPIPTPDGRSTVTREGRTLALLTFVDGVGLNGTDESEQRLIGATLARAHAAIAGLEIASAERFPRLDAEAEHLGIRPWIRPAIADALAAWERLVPASLTWGLIHSDPAPEAFLADRAAGECGLIDWDRALVGPLMYDLASAVMYVGGMRYGAALVDGYATLQVLEAAEIERTLVPMLQLRWAVQADYFAGRIATNDMTGINDESENEQGLDDARRALLEVLGEG
jgi:Ser/Thr protein kinase RdoA (MazF antagonist)